MVKESSVVRYSSVILLVAVITRECNAWVSKIQINGTQNASRRKGSFSILVNLYGYGRSSLSVSFVLKRAHHRFCRRLT